MPDLSYYDNVVSRARSVFKKKLGDYGLAWTILRWESLLDQLWIKAKRIRTLQETKENRVGESAESEYLGIINYCVMGLMRLWYPEVLPDTEKIMRSGEVPDADADRIMDAYNKVTARVKELLAKKEHDYGQAWKDMSQKAITDQVLVKILRAKSLAKQGRIKELDQHLQDILNYSVFALSKDAPVV